MLYLIGSLRNPQIPTIGNTLRSAGFNVFDDWHAAGPEADDEWQRYETERGRSYAEALQGEAARNVFYFDMDHLDACDTAVLVLPAGRSAHMEFGYMIGSDKPAYVLFDQPPERYDVMYKLATAVVFGVEELVERLRND